MITAIAILKEFLPIQQNEVTKQLIQASLRLAPTLKDHIILRWIYDSECSTSLYGIDTETSYNHLESLIAKEGIAIQRFPYGCLFFTDPDLEELDPSIKTLLKTLKEYNPLRKYQKDARVLSVESYIKSLQER